MKNKLKVTKVQNDWIGDSPDLAEETFPMEPDEDLEVLPELKHKHRIKIVKEKMKSVKDKRLFKDVKARKR